MSNHTKSDFGARRLFLIEFYTPNGADIHFAWVFAPTSGDALDTLRTERGAGKDDIITWGEQAEITPLAGSDWRVNTPDANLFILENVAAIRADQERFLAQADRELRASCAAHGPMPYGC